MSRESVKNVMSEPIAMRLAAFSIAIITGSILYTMFFEGFVGEGQAAIWLAVCCAFGSALLIDRTIARARDLRDEQGGISVGRSLGYFLLLASCAFVFVLDRGAEIFVMQSHRTKDLQSDRKTLEEKAKNAPQIKSREARINSLRNLVASEARSDSINIALARQSFRKRSEEVASMQRYIRREIAKARERGDDVAVSEWESKLAASGRERQVAQAGITGAVTTSRAWHFAADLAREDSLLNSELTAELARISVDSQELTSAGFERNPVGFVLSVAPSSILWAIVFGLLMTAALAEKHIPRARKIALAQSSNASMNGVFSQPTVDFGKMAATMANGAGVHLLVTNNESEDKPGPFPRGDIKAACDWLWWMVLSNRYQTTYKDEKAGDFAFALRRACGDTPARRMSRQKSKLYRSLTMAKKFKDVGPPEKVAEKLKELAYFETQPKGAAQTISN